MNYYGDENPHCCLHPKEVIIGICALCLKERLLVLAAKQRNLPLPKDSHRPQRKPNLNLPKVFALSSLLQRQESRRRKSDASNHDTFASHEDSFISIKFEGNGHASWDTGTSCRSSSSESFEILYPQNKDFKEEKCVVEHVKPRMSTVRWKKRIGHLVQLMRWKRSNKAGVSHAGIVEGGKGRKGWIRALTKRRAME